MTDGIDHGGINMSGIGHEGGDAGAKPAPGVSERESSRADLKRQIEDLAKRVDVLEQDQRERILP